MDVDYGHIGGPEGPEYVAFQRALTILATLVSRQSQTAIVDGGYKSFSTDRLSHRDRWTSLA